MTKSITSMLHRKLRSWYRNPPKADCFQVGTYEVLSWYVIQANKTGGRSQQKLLWFQSFAVLSMLYSFFWVIPRRLNFVPTFRNTPSVPPSYVVWTRIYPSNLVPVIRLVHTTYKDGTERSEKSAHKTQTAGESSKRKNTVKVIRLCTADWNVCWHCRYVFFSWYFYK